jgi:8-oxo-dGTP pyrophosphatase MutT (NUDIX family)
LDYIARAITPPGQVRRFDARFFLADAAHLHGTLAGNGELHHLHWVPLNRAQALPLAPITRAVLELLKARYGLPAELAAIRAALGGRELPEYYL